MRFLLYQDVYALGCRVQVSIVTIMRLTKSSSQMKMERPFHLCPPEHRGCIIKAENIGQSSGDLFAIRKEATDEYCQAY